MARRILLFALLVLTLAPAAHAEDPTLETLIADLDDQNVTKRSSALNALRARKDERAIGLLEEAAPGFGLYGQYYAVMVLESYPEKSVQRTFTRFARGDDPYLKLCAGSYFLRRNDATYADAVVEALETPGLTLQVRQYMVNRLYSLTEPRVRAALRKMLVAGETITLLGSVFWALQNQEEEVTKEAARTLLETDDRADARALAAAYLYRFGDEARKTEIAEAFRSGELTTAPFYRVKYFLEQAGHVAREILDAATEALDETQNAILLRYLVEFLAAYRHPKALSKIRKLVSHENATVAKAAFEAVVEMGVEIEKEDLLRLLDAEDPDRRLAAADLLRRMDDLRGLDAVVGVLRTGKPLERREAAQTLGRFRVRRAVDPLLDALMDEDANVRTNALYAVDGLLRALFPYRRLDLVATGYVAAAPLAQRKAAVDRLRTWWQAHREGDW